MLSAPRELYHREKRTEEEVSLVEWVFIGIGSGLALFALIGFGIAELVFRTTRG